MLLVVNLIDDLLIVIIDGYLMASQEGGGLVVLLYFEVRNERPAYLMMPRVCTQYPGCVLCAVSDSHPAGLTCVFSASSAAGLIHFWREGSHLSRRIILPQSPRNLST